MKNSFTFGVMMLLMAGMVAPAVSLAATDTATSTSASSTKSSKIIMLDKRKSVGDWACVATAVGAREDAIASAFGTFSTKVSAILKDRKTALVAASGMTEATARKTARKAAWAKYKADHQAASAVYKSARKDAYTTFSNAVKTTCKLPAAASEETEKNSADPVL